MIKKEDFIVIHALKAKGYSISEISRLMKLDRKTVRKLLEKAKLEKEAHGEIETQHPGYLGSQDTYYVGNLKGVGRI